MSHESSIFGYIGLCFLIIKLVPIIYEQIKENKNVNLCFVLSELCASIFLGISSILIKSYPFMLVNAFTFISVIIILIIKMIKYKNIN
tara:strand:+ start:98 stop:361 length:264 start_codon:yes stop_codon:yes gene_type:complete